MLPPLPRPPQGAPWGTRGSLYNYDTACFLGSSLGPATLRLVREAARTADRQIAKEGGGYSLGALVQRVAVARGVHPDVAKRCGVVVDALVVAWDMADNVADREMDLAAGRSLDTSYPGIPLAQQVALPALVVGGVMAGVVQHFPNRLHSLYMVSRLTAVLDTLVVGQGRELTDVRRLDEVSGVEGALFALPWWYQEGSDSETAHAVERWGRAYARTWQARRDLLERADDDARERYAEARERARAAWLDGAPFGPGEFMDFTRLVPEVP